MTTKAEYEKVVTKLKEISEKGIVTRIGKVEPFLFASAIDNDKTISVHGKQFNHSHINKFCSLLNKIDCEFWIYPSNAIDGWTMLVVNIF